MNKSIISISAMAALCCTLLSSSVSAQGLKIFLKNGAVTNIPYEQLDKVVPYEDEAPGPNPGEHEYVDLGLSVKWATCNVGATTPGEAGDYYMWASTECDPNVSYNKINAPYQDPYYADPDAFMEYFTKYCNTDQAGVPDYIYTLEAMDDAATANWGDGWRMPTNDEMVELLEQCTWTWMTADDTTNEYAVAGFRVTGPNGSSIFLPAAGYRFSTSVWYGGEEVHYWTSSLTPTSCLYAQCLEMSKYGEKVAKVTYAGRYMGKSVRPVLK